MATEPRSSRCRLGELGSMAGLLDLPGLTCDVCGDRGDDDADDEDDRAGPDDLLDGDRASLVTSVLDDAVLHAGDHGEGRHLEGDEELQHRGCSFLGGGVRGVPDCCRCQVASRSIDGVTRIAMKTMPSRLAGMYMRSETALAFPS